MFDSDSHIPDQTQIGLNAWSGLKLEGISSTIVFSCLRNFPSISPNSLKLIKVKLLSGTIFSISLDNHS